MDLILPALRENTSCPFEEVNVTAMVISYCLTNQTDLGA